MNEKITPLDLIDHEASFMDSLLTPITLLSGFLLAVTFYLVDLEVSRDPGATYPEMAFEISVFVIFFIASLIALNCVVSARIMNRVYFGKMYSRGYSFEELLTVLGFFSFITTTCGVAYLVPVISYSLMGFTAAGSLLATVSLGINIVSYLPIIISFVRSRE